MYQVGQKLTFNVTVASGTSRCYVWSFWDGVTTATREPNITKVLNKGGTLAWSVTPVDNLGRGTPYNGSITVNDPPKIESLTLSHNDLPPPYSSILGVVISDPDSAPVSGGDKIRVTWNGTVQNITATQSGTLYGPLSFAIDVDSPATLPLIAVDKSGGTTQFDVDIRTAPTRPVIVGAVANPPTQRIGSTQTVVFGARVTDLNNGGTPTFLWEFLSDDGWVPISSTAGVTQSLGSGVYQNTAIIPTTGQNAGVVRAKLTVTPVIGSVTVVKVPVTLIANVVPQIIDFQVSPEVIISGQPGTLTAVVEDGDGDHISYDWTLTNPPAKAFDRQTIQTITDGSIFVGELTVTDPLGASSTRSIPSVIITSSLDNSGTLNSNLTYVPHAMGVQPITWAATGLPSGLSLVNGTIVGVPSVAGVTNSTLVATSPQGSDTRTVVFRIVAQPVAPLSPNNIRINGSGTNPRYRSGEDVTVQWTITTDGGAIPSTVVELRDVSGSLKSTLSYPQGEDIATISNAEIISVFGSETSFTVRVYAERGGIRSIIPAEVRVNLVA